MKQNILLTGRPGIGKSTVIAKVTSQLDLGSAGGFWSEEIREGGRRVGFAIKTLEGERGVLAHVNVKNGPQVGRYTVNIQDIDQIIVPSLKIALEAELIIIIDEIARMELYSRAFADIVRRCLDSGRVLGTIQVRHGGFVQEVRNRSDVEILEVTHANRNELPKRIWGFISSSF
jgi:nucleoside-triphosphatase